jgi:hypothetical protein
MTVDLLAGLGVLYAGERERLHRVLDSLARIASV